MLLTSTEADRYRQTDRCDTPEAQPWHGPRQEDWESVLFQRHMKRHPSDTYILFVKSQSQQEPSQLKETHHPNTYTHSGMHIQKSPLCIPKESWKCESGTNLLLQRGVITIGIIWSLPNHYHPINDSQPLSHTELSQNLTGLVLFPTSALGLHPDSSLSNYRL